MWLCPVHSCSGSLPDKWIQSYQPAWAFRRHTFLWTLLGLAGALCSFVPLWSQRTQRSKITSCGWNRKKVRRWVFLYAFIIISRGALNIFVIIPDLCLLLLSYTISTHCTYTYIHTYTQKKYKTTLTRNVYWPWDDAVLSEFPWLSDVDDCGFLSGQKNLQLLICHVCTRWTWTEPAKQQHRS